MACRMWDVKPFVGGNDGNKRLVKSFAGATHNFEKNLLRSSWNHDDSLVSGGSADRLVYVWEVDSGKMVHRLGGHQGSVNET